MDIIQKVKELNLPLGQYVVFGSGPLAVHGIRPTRDADLLVTTGLYQRLKGEGWPEKELDDGSRCLARDIYEIDDSWHHGDYHPSPEEIIAKAEMVEGVPFAPLEEVLKWKLAFGRPKDQADVELIKAYLAQRI
jgi:hypothetical protein